MSELEQLLARIEAATDFDRDLDRAIGLALAGWKLVEVATPNPTIMLEIDGDLYPDHPGSMYPSFTESVDETLALVERKLPGQSHTIVSEALDILAGEGHLWANVLYHQQLPLAILAALLRALIARTLIGEREG